MGEHRAKSVDSSWSEPLGAPVATAPTRSLPIAPSALAAGTETLAALTASVPAPARSDDATPIVSPLPATPRPASFPVAPRTQWHRLLPFALAGGALLGVIVAVLSVVLPSAPAAPAPAPAPAAPAPAPEPARVATPAAAPVKAAPKKKKPKSPARPVKKKPVAKRAVKR